MHGLTLVVEHIDDQDKLARVFGFGVLLGQGQLFGGARPVRADVASGRRSTTAAA
jgi:cyclic-di-GMP phosphodiesterase TipF (flagellum assembly factor)